jgi:Mg/Co/Ni transporter MgtE
MIVEDLMTRNPASVRPEQDLARAAHLMWERDCGALPVVDETCRVIGKQEFAPLRPTRFRALAPARTPEDTA